MTSRALRRAARAGLKGKWYIGILITLLSLLIGAYSFGPLPQVAMPMEEWIKDPSVLIREWRSIFYLDIRTLRAGLFFLLGAAGITGQCHCYLRLTRGEDCRVRELFHCYPQMHTAIAMRVLRWLYTVLGLSLFLLPGLYIRYTYALAPWILAEEPDTTARQAMLRSKQLMKGNRGRLLLLDLSFVGWLALCALSLGLGLLFLIPYHSMARAGFYLALKEQSR